MKVLVVEDVPVVAMHIEERLIGVQICTAIATTADDALRHLEADRSITHVITDVDMSGSMDGLRLAHIIRTRWPPLHLIVMSGRHRLSDADLPERAQFLAKPFESTRLYHLLSYFPS